MHNKELMKNFPIKDDIELKKALDISSRIYSIFVSTSTSVMNVDEDAATERCLTRIVRIIRRDHKDFFRKVKKSLEREKKVTV